MDSMIFLFFFLMPIVCGIMGWFMAGPGQRGPGMVYGFFFGPFGLIAAWVIRQRAEAQEERERIMSENIALMAAIASGEQKPRSHAPTAIPASSLTDVPDELTIRRNGEIIGTWPLADVLGYLATGELVPTDHYLHNAAANQWRLLSRIA